MNLKAKKLNDLELESISGGHPCYEIYYLVSPILAGMILGSALGLWTLSKLLSRNNKKKDKKEHV